AIEPKIVHKPDIHSTITSVDVTADAVIVNTMTKVKSRLLRYIMNDGEWINHSIFKELKNGVIYISNTSPHRQDYTLSFQNFLTPATLYHVPPVPSPRVKLKQAPRHFDASRLTVQQHWATSKDGTQVPYFLVGDKNRRSDGKNPTLLYAYGGFEISMRPWYSSTTGINWFARGGVYALANIRGGGEFGPSWHQSALKTKRNKTYEDFIAVAENLIRKGITTPRHLGIRGGSNGGLLTGVALTKRPDLFNAVVCQVPLLDMQRYTKLLAGHSWIAEYGDPEIPEIWNFWKKWSPYHNIQKDIKYPRVLFTTSTKDDRVHPGHARKMVARMKKQGHSVLYYENIEGGHSGAANLKQTAYAQAIAYAYLLQQLK
ncbi:MAG: S9 family peptidase, partial [Opitutae bacterium]|nr:S9 family peptidase [Opitutae bacterium]